MSMLKSNFDFYWDEYVHFTFNNIHSSQFNLYIQNNVDDLKLIINDGAKIDFASPKYSEGQYVLGVTRSQRKFPLKLVAHSLNRRQIMQMHKWLKIGTTSSLSFDFSSDWCYDVIVNTLSDFNLYPQDEENELFIVSFSIEWITTTKTYARNKFNALGYYGDHSQEYVGNQTNEIFNKQSATSNSLGVPAFAIKEDGTTKEVKVRINHLGDKHTAFRIDHYYPAQSQTAKINLNIRTNEDILPFSTSFSGELSNNATEHIISYSSEGNIFFADGEMPQKLDLQGHYKSKGLNIEYAHEPIVLQSPGSLIEIKEEDLDFLPFAPYHWFICSVVSEPTQNIYAIDTGEQATKLEKVEGLYSGSGFSSIIKYDDDDFDIGNDIKQTGAKYYLGYYDEIIITDNSEYAAPDGTYSGVIQLTCYTEVI